MRPFRRALMIIGAALVLAACGLGDDLPRFDLRALNSNEATAIRKLGDAADPNHDPGLAALLAAGYQPFAYTEGKETEDSPKEYRLYFDKCGNKAAVDCFDKVKPANDKPRVALHLTGMPDPNNGALTLSGRFHLAFPAKNKNTPLRCVITAHQPVAGTSGLTPEVVGQFKTIGNAFNNEGGQRALQPGVVWSCIRHVTNSDI